MKEDLAEGILLIGLGVLGIGVIIKGLAQKNWVENWTGFEVALIISVAVCAIYIMGFSIAAGKFLIEDSHKKK